jgi:hypothetical protein
MTKRQKVLEQWYAALSEFKLLLISSWINFGSVTAVPKYMNCVTFSKYLVHIFISRYYRVLIMVYNTQRYWVFGLCPSSGYFLNNNGKTHWTSDWG